MANNTIRGIDIRQASGSKLVIQTQLYDDTGAILTTGTVAIRIYEQQDDGTFKSYDFDDGTFKTTALTTETAAMTHQQGNNNTTDTGIWSYSFSSIAGFTEGAIYIVQVICATASPVVQSRMFQFGGAEGDTVNAIWEDTFAELTSVPAATPKAKELLMLLFMELRNAGTATASAKTIKKDDGTTIGTASLSDDGTTFTKGKIS